MRVVAMLGAVVLLLAVALALWSGARGADGPLECAERRVLAYGRGETLRSIAELRAIVRWMSEAAELGRGFDNWSLAGRRWLQCRKVWRTDLLQCSASALPCRRRADGEASRTRPASFP